MDIGPIVLLGLLFLMFLAAAALLDFFFATPQRKGTIDPSVEESRSSTY